MRRGWGGRLEPVPIDDDLSGPSLYLPEEVVADVERLLRTYHEEEEHEGVVYLGGLEVDGSAVALIALSPAAETTNGSFRTHLEANTAVVGTLGKFGLTLIGQVHSHPGEWVDHSDGDDQGALVRFRGYWSLVAPGYARDGMRPLVRCGVHLFTERRFRRLTEGAVTARVRVIPTSVDLRSG